MTQLTPLLILFSTQQRSPMRRPDANHRVSAPRDPTKRCNLLQNLVFAPAPPGDTPGDRGDQAEVPNIVAQGTSRLTSPRLSHRSTGRWSSTRGEGGWRGVARWDGFFLGDTKENTRHGVGSTSVPANLDGGSGSIFHLSNVLTLSG